MNKFQWNMYLYDTVSLIRILEGATNLGGKEVHLGCNNWNWIETLSASPKFANGQNPARLREGKNHKIICEISVPVNFMTDFVLKKTCRTQHTIYIFLVWPTKEKIWTIYDDSTTRTRCLGWSSSNHPLHSCRT